MLLLITAWTPPLPTYPPPVVYTPDIIPPPLEARALDLVEYDAERNMHMTRFENRPMAGES